jgi:hypothetical protein
MIRNPMELERCGLCQERKKAAKQPQRPTSRNTAQIFMQRSVLREVERATQAVFIRIANWPAKLGLWAVVYRDVSASQAKKAKAEV